jgi:hypothetical protein
MCSQIPKPHELTNLRPEPFFRFLPLPLEQWAYDQPAEAVPLPHDPNIK